MKKKTKINRKNQRGGMNTNPPHDHAVIEHLSAEQLYDYIAPNYPDRKEIYSYINVNKIAEIFKLMLGLNMGVRVIEDLELLEKKKKEILSRWYMAAKKSIDKEKEMRNLLSSGDAQKIKEFESWEAMIDQNYEAHEQRVLEDRLEKLKAAKAAKAAKAEREAQAASIHESFSVRRNSINSPKEQLTNFKDPLLRKAAVKFQESVNESLLVSQGWNEKGGYVSLNLDFSLDDGIYLEELLIILILDSVHDLSDTTAHARYNGPIRENEALGILFFHYFRKLYAAKNDSFATLTKEGDSNRKNRQATFSKNNENPGNENPDVNSRKGFNICTIRDDGNIGWDLPLYNPDRKGKTDTFYRGIGWRKGQLFSLYKTTPPSKEGDQYQKSYIPFVSSFNKEGSPVDLYVSSYGTDADPRSEAATRSLYVDDQLKRATALAEFNMPINYNPNSIRDGTKFEKTLQLKIKFAEDKFLTIIVDKEGVKMCDHANDDPRADESFYFIDDYVRVSLGVTNTRNPNQKKFFSKKELLILLRSFLKQVNDGQQTLENYILWASHEINQQTTDTAMDIQQLKTKLKKLKEDLKKKGGGKLEKQKKKENPQYTTTETKQGAQRAKKREEEKVKVMSENINERESILNKLIIKSMEKSLNEGNMNVDFKIKLMKLLCLKLLGDFFCLMPSLYTKHGEQELYIFDGDYSAVITFLSLIQLSRTSLLQCDEQVGDAKVMLMNSKICIDNVIGKQDGKSLSKFWVTINPNKKDYNNWLPLNPFSYAFLDNISSSIVVEADETVPGGLHAKISLRNMDDRLRQRLFSQSMIDINLRRSSRDPNSANKRRRSIVVDDEGRATSNLVSQEDIEEINAKVESFVSEWSPGEGRESALMQTRRWSKGVGARSDTKNLQWKPPVGIKNPIKTRKNFKRKKNKKSLKKKRKHKIISLKKKKRKHKNKNKSKKGRK